MFQGLAIQEFHHKKDARILFADFMNGANVGMVQCGGRSSLTAESFKGLLVLR